MTSNTSIKVESLGKLYLLRRKAAPTDRYTSLRDVLSKKIQNLIQKYRHLSIDRELVKEDVIEEFWAISNINFEIKKGERVGIIGRNGAGKSTLLKILSRITEPTQGRIEIKGRVVSLLEVGTGFHPELTGRENIYLNGALLGMTRREIQQKFDAIVEFAEIERFLDTPVKRYSSGMYVRLAFSVAAHVDPEILIVDEVLAVGDSQFQKKCLGKVSELGDSGRTVIFVSHNLGVINGLCNRAILLDGGQILMDDIPSKVIERYLNGAEEAAGEVCFLPRLEADVEILRIAIVPIDSISPSENIAFQQPFRIEIEVSVKEQIDAVIGLAILDAGGEVLTTFHTVEIGEDEANSINLKMTAGLNKYSVLIAQNVLRPNSYHISASIFSRRLHQTFDYRESVLNFTVNDHGDGCYFDTRQQGSIIFRDLVWERN
jgi:lipopolysaccharide transport system ATP-binding protein